MHFDSTINLGSIITIVLVLIAAVFAWRDMNWRLKNLETWRHEEIEGKRARAVLDDRFQNAVGEFRLAIGELKIMVAAMDKEAERHLFRKINP